MMSIRGCGDLKSTITLRAKKKGGILPIFLCLFKLIFDRKTCGDAIVPKCTFSEMLLQVIRIGILGGANSSQLDNLDIEGRESQIVASVCVGSLGSSQS